MGSGNSKNKRKSKQQPQKMVKIAIIYYSMYGHIRKLAHAEAKGAKEAGVEVDVFQVPETLSDEVLAAMHAPGKGDDKVADFASLSTLKDYDGFIFGIPTRFGMMAAQMKAFWDMTGQLWQKGELVGKPVGVFTSVGTQGGGIETTALTALTQFTHHGMIFVPTGYSFGAEMFDVSTVHGGTPYGAGTIAGPDGSRQPSDYELRLAEHQGKYFSNIVKKLSAKIASV
eukprot:m.221642 g.221642  ORF g.221642 m.221642 type:complete len:227 (-) comp15854_c0_seq1:206-886(-)